MRHNDIDILPRGCKGFEECIEHLSRITETRRSPGEETTKNITNVTGLRNAPDQRLNL
jgi:hypothetical protein